MGKEVIDRVYDTLEKGADTLGAILGVDMRDPAPAPADPVTARAAIERGARHARMLTGGSALPERAPFRIEEVIDGETGKMTYLVTNGIERAECPTRAFADQVIAALRVKGAR